MKKLYFLIILLASLFFAGLVLAATEPTYPIADLGNCKDKNDCMDFCNNPDNMTACVDYGQKSGMLSAEEARISKKVAEKIKAGTMPGNCKTKDQCESFCQGNVTNLEQCLSTAQDLGISSASIDEGRKVLEALKAGAQMPGDCKTKSDCESYCSDPEHIDDCLSFAEKAQLISPQDLAEAKKVAPFLKSGQTPGGCKTKEECNNYCADASHSDACINFAETAGFISKDEAEMARKSGGAGPGGCKSTEECNKYCQDQSHMQECIDFGIKVGAIKQEDVQKIKEGAKMIKDGLGKIPEGARSSAESCLNGVFDGKLQDVLDNKVQITKDQGDKIGPCFENAVKSFIKSQMPNIGSGGGARGEGEGGIPEDIQGPPSGVQGPPSGVQGPPSGTQGPPCSSPEECARMFGPQR